jgi:hypothetical protein
MWESFIKENLDNSDGLKFLITFQNFKIEVKYVHNYIILYLFYCSFHSLKKKNHSGLHFNNDFKEF